MSEVWKEKETEFLQMYVDDLKALAPEKEGEKASLFEKCIAGDNEAVKRLVELYLMKSVQIASKYTGQGLSLADLIQEANVALMLALTEIDSSDNAYPCETERISGTMLTGASKATGHSKRNKTTAQSA